MTEQVAQTDESAKAVESPLTEITRTALEQTDSWMAKIASSVVGDYPWLQALLLLLLVLALAKLANWVVNILMARLYAQVTKINPEVAVKKSAPPVFWSLALPGFLVVASLYGVSSGTLDLFINIVLSVLICLWMVFGFRTVKLLLTTASSNARPSSLLRPQTLPLFMNLSALGLFAVGTFFLFQVWRIDMSAWLASAGILGIAIGFAAKDSLANLFSGVFILADSPYRVGDYIVLDDGNLVRGKVKNIGIRSTRILTRDDIEVTVPNAIMGNSMIINESGGPHVKYRIRVPVGVAYGTDIDQVYEILLSIASDCSDVCSTPEPRVRFREFGPSALNFELLCWIEDPEYKGRVVDALNYAIYNDFKKQGIEIPFAKRDVYVKEFPKGDTES